MSASRMTAWPAAGLFELLNFMASRTLFTELFLFGALAGAANSKSTRAPARGGITDVTHSNPFKHHQKLATGAFQWGFLS